jgi:hypothetical protein
MSSAEKTDRKQNLYNGIFAIITAIIACLGYIIVALINRSSSFIPIHATQTAEALYTSIAATTQTYFPLLTPTPAISNPSSTLTPSSPTLAVTSIHLPPTGMPNTFAISPLNILSIVNYLLPVLFVLAIEYFIMQPFQRLETNRRKRFMVAILNSVTLLVPLYILRETALILTQTLSSTLSDAQRIETYVNLYGIFALIWGVIWTMLVRPYLYSLYR